MPSNNFKRLSIRTITNVSISRSAFTFQQQVQEFSGQIWIAEITLPIMSRVDAEAWVCFLLKLNGPLGTFMLGDPSAKTPAGSATGTPLVKGASQTGKSLITDGWTPSITNILKAGDYIQIGNRLYKNLTDATSNGSGEATLDIFPRLRESPADNASIITSNCKGEFRLLTNDNLIYSADEAKNYEVSFSAMEYIPAN